MGCSSMVNLIEKYYKAWETKDLSLLQETIHKTIYGIRTYSEEKLFTNEELFKYFAISNSFVTKIIKTSLNEDEVKLILEIDDKKVVAKITFKDNKIYKVYEEIPATNRRLKCIVSYDGSAYSGYQKQPNQPTIQETLETIIQKALNLKSVVKIHSSGRTDKGVHAINQVFHFDIESTIESSRIKLILNTNLPDSIYIKHVEEVDHTFHSRYDVKEKEYVYKINIKEFDPIQRNYEWYIKNVDLNIFKEQLKDIIGTHDFTSFTKSNNNPTNIRTIFNAFIEEKDNHIFIHIKGSGFLRYMVRNIIGAIYAISNKKANYTIKELLKQKDVNLIKDKAPASGLYLFNVKY